MNRFKLSFIHAARAQKGEAVKTRSLLPSPNGVQISDRDRSLVRPSLDAPPVIGWEVRLKVRGHKWLLVSAHQEFCGRGPYCGHKSCCTADQGS